MRDVWVVNASPVITLAKAGHLALLTEMADETLLPEAVAAELLIASAAAAARQAVAGGWGTRIPVREVPAGDTASKPPGAWTLVKRRSLLGHSTGSASGVMVLKTEHLGMHAPVPEMAVATGFRVFKSGAGYFHEGMSLPECVLPVVKEQVREYVALAMEARRRIKEQLKKRHCSPLPNNIRHRQRGPLLSNTTARHPGRATQKCCGWIWVVDRHG